MITQAPSPSTTAPTLLARLARHRHSFLPAAFKGNRSLYALGLVLRLAFFVGLIARSVTLLHH